MKVWIFVEGKSDALALAALWSGQKCGPARGGKPVPDIPRCDRLDW